MVVTGTPGQSLLYPRVPWNWNRSILDTGAIWTKVNILATGAQGAALMVTPLFCHKSEWRH